MRVIDIIESDFGIDPNALFAMAKELGIRKIQGIGSANEFVKLQINREIEKGFEPKANAVISAYIAKYGIYKEIEGLSK